MDRYIDIYCERLEPGLWAEPVNAITNISFFIAAFFAILLARKHNALDWRSGALIFFVTAIGIGSSLFHTHATLWAMLSDSLPILFYQIAFLMLYTRFVMGLTILNGSLYLAAFIITVIGFYQLPHDWLNGSIGYAPAIIFLALFSHWHWKNGKVEKYLLAEATGIFAVSLTFRSVDIQICDGFPLGAHFMWHILNGVVLYMTTRAFILNVKP